MPVTIANIKSFWTFYSYYLLPTLEGQLGTKISSELKFTYNELIY